VRPAKEALLQKNDPTPLRARHLPSDTFWREKQIGRGLNDAPFIANAGIWVIASWDAPAKVRTHGY